MESGVREPVRARAGDGQGKQGNGAKCVYWWGGGWRMRGECGSTPMCPVDLQNLVLHCPGWRIPMDGGLDDPVGLAPRGVGGRQLNQMHRGGALYHHSNAVG